MWLTVGLPNGERDKCDASDRPSDDHDNTCTIVLTTLCVSAIDVCIANTTQTQTFNITRARLQAWHRNQHVEDNSWSEKRKGRKTCRGNTWNDFLSLHTCMLLRAGWYDNDKQSCKLTKKCTSQGVLYLPHLPSRWSCVQWSLHVVPIFSITRYLGPSPQLLRSDLGMPPFHVVSRRWISVVSAGSYYSHNEALGSPSTQYLHPRPRGHLGQHYVVLRNMTQLRDGGPGRTTLCSF